MGLDRWWARQCARAVSKHIKYFGTDIRNHAIPYAQDAAMLKHTLLSVQQTRSCSIYFRTLQGGSAIQVCKALCSKPICRQMGDRLRRKQSSWTWGRPCSSSCALGRALAYLIFPFLRSPMSARRWNALPHFQKQPHHTALPFVIISPDVTAGNLCLPCCPSHTFEMPVR